MCSVAVEVITYHFLNPLTEWHPDLVKIGSNFVFFSVFSKIDFNWMHPL